MTTTFTDGNYSITPNIVSGLTRERETRNIVHDILGALEPAFTLRPAKLRTGTMLAVFDQYSTASYFQDFLAFTTVPITMSDSDSGFTFLFIPTGSMRLEKVEGVARWTVEVTYQEVYP